MSQRLLSCQGGAIASALRGKRCTRACSPARFRHSPASRTSVSSPSSYSSLMLVPVIGFAGAVSQSLAYQHITNSTTTTHSTRPDTTQSTRTGLAEQMSISADAAATQIQTFAHDWVRWIPGGPQYVDKAMFDWASAREHHREAADAIIQIAYAKFEDISKANMSIGTASRYAEVFADLVKDVESLPNQGQAQGSSRAVEDPHHDLEMVVQYRKKQYKDNYLWGLEPDYL